MDYKRQLKYHELTPDLYDECFMDDPSGAILISCSDLGEIASARSTVIEIANAKKRNHAITTTSVTGDGYLLLHVQLRGLR